MASYVDAWVPNYEMEDGAMSGYYVYSLRPLSIAKAPRNIRVAFISHSLWLHKSSSPWLLQLKKLDRSLAKKLGADYELINSALIDGDRCAASSISLNSWLYLPKFQVVESVVSNRVDLRGTFCYAKLP
jgi:hypothetical protein